MKKFKVLLDEETIAKRVRELGEQITRDYAGAEHLVVVPIMKGSFLFAADLIRHIDRELSVEFLGLRSYGAGTETSGVVQITYDLTQSVTHQHVLVVEDIVDTGLSMRYLMENLSTRQPRSLKLCSLLHKPARTRVTVPIDYLGFTIDDHFVVGYGLDYAEKFRNLPYIGVIEN
ncbi:MAG: hypoxanthine phosphoribosyltransferase [Deltaproteobacteria bacterium]|jgi:hypoxanthine phosphoribosyltransferase|nr:hypoxanthine phosphoribosyltransferase [Deltaproteobacteria bacterium]MBK8692967.1 hypoxanthine phosphoribosyltransferase [Deltaproteobacteria bacterium]MBP6835063.1 hypoxanthine phosphoribosyltransferase [Deltaproteobacteria bacterium]TAK33124.1 MAG: hypoxanthine phosphoribosyltransferase [Myxococcaceae bacterium]